MYARIHGSRLIRPALTIVENVINANSVVIMRPKIDEEYQLLLFLWSIINTRTDQNNKMSAIL